MFTIHFLLSHIIPVQEQLKRKLISTESSVRLELLRER